MLLYVWGKNDMLQSYVHTPQSYLMSLPGTQTLVVVTPVDEVAVDKLIWLSATEVVLATAVAGETADVTADATADGPLCSKNLSCSLLVGPPCGPPATADPTAVAWPAGPAGPAAPVGGCERRAWSWLTPAPPVVLVPALPAPTGPVLEEATPEADVTASVEVAIHYWKINNNQKYNKRSLNIKSNLSLLYVRKRVSIKSFFL